MASMAGEREQIFTISRRIVILRNKESGKYGPLSRQRSRLTPTLHNPPPPPEGVAKDIRATVGCAVRTIPNKESRLPNGAHGAPYIAFTHPPPERGCFLSSPEVNSRITGRQHATRYIQALFCVYAEILCNSKVNPKSDRLLDRGSRDQSLDQWHGNPVCH
jgi:hypothetical protein